MRVNNLSIDEDGKSFIKGWEAFVGYLYDDKVPPRKVKGKLVYKEWRGEPLIGTLTIGYGHTKAAKAVVDMSVGARMTEEEACRVLDIDLDPVEADINNSVKVPLSQSQFNALCDLGHNIGPIKKASTLLARLNRGDYDGACAALDLYVRSQGQVMRGLQSRRDAEQKLWNKAAPAAKLVPDIPEFHPADVDEPKPTKTMASSTEGWTHVGTATAATAGAVREVVKDAPPPEVTSIIDKAIDAKQKADALGVDVSPVGMWDYIGPHIPHVVASPVFWVCAALAAFAAYGWFRRRHRLYTELA